MKKLGSLVVIIVIGFYSCSKTTDSSGNLYTPTNADVTANASLNELNQGRSLYIGSCNACHQLYSPDDYSPSQWKSILSKMAPRTSLSSAQVTLVTKYVSRGKQ